MEEKRAPPAALSLSASQYELYASHVRNFHPLRARDGEARAFSSPFLRQSKGFVGRGKAEMASQSERDNRVDSVVAPKIRRFSKRPEVNLIIGSLKTPHTRFGKTGRRGGARNWRGRGRGSVSVSPSRYRNCQRNSFPCHRSVRKGTDHLLRDFRESFVGRIVSSLSEGARFPSVFPKSIFRRVRDCF